MLKVKFATLPVTSTKLEILVKIIEPIETIEHILTLKNPEVVK